MVKTATSVLPKNKRTGVYDHLPPDNYDDNPDSITIICEVTPSITAPAKKLKLVPLVILIFYNVSGGPFGIEPAVQAGGNFFALLGFLIFPFIWSIPEALMTAEMGSAFPEDASGGVAWVEEAFGKEMGMLCGYLGWISGATDNAIYPTLFLEYVASINAFNDDGDTSEGSWLSNLQDDEATRVFFVSALSILLAGLNYTGLEIVGNASLIICILSMSPFIIMFLMGCPKVEPNKWLEMPSYINGTAAATEFMNDDQTTASGPLAMVMFGGVLWRPFINNLFWNLNSFDSGANFAPEVIDLNETYPKGIFGGLLCVVLGYLLPLMIATGATKSEQKDWTDGHLATIASEIGGNWLGGWTVFAAGISNISLFEAEMSADSYAIMGMADRGILPRIFQTRSTKFGTPVYGILLNLFVILLMSSMANFSELVEMLNSNYAISLLIEYAAFVKLRFSRKDLSRPYRVPLPDWAIIILVIPPCMAIILMFAISSWKTYYFVIIVTLLGVILYKVKGFLQDRGWCIFEQRIVQEPLPQDPNEDDLVMEEEKVDNDTSEKNGKKCSFSFITNSI